MTHYEEQGDGPALVVVGGLVSTRAFFRDAVRELSADHRVITVELPGHGSTPVGDRPVTAARVIEDIGTLLVELDLRDVTLMGWSLGATLAYGYVAENPDKRVTRLISVDQTPRLTTAPDWEHASFGGLDAEGVAQLRAGIAADFDAFAETLVRSCFAAGSEPPQDVCDALIAEARRCDSTAVSAMLAEAAAIDWREQVAAINVPTLLVHGARSQVCPTPIGEWMARTIPGAQLETFEESGHVPFVEETQRFADVVRAFVAR